MCFLTTISFNNRYGSFALTSINKLLCQAPIYVYDNHNLYFRETNEEDVWAQTLKNCDAKIYMNENTIMQQI
jgi:hypothetical protein